MAKIVGNDIASFQGDIDYNKYKDNSNFVLMKVTEGTGFLDPKFKRNQSEARRVGLALGYYHFAKPDLGNTPEKEAQYFLDQIGPLQEGEVLALDYEVQFQDPIVWCKAWLDYVFQKTGVKPLIYMSESVVIKYDWSRISSAGYGLWIAKYLFNPTPDAAFNTGKWAFAAMYQWTSGQKVPGIPVERVDGDVFFGDIATFKRYGYKAPVPVPTPTDWQKLYNDEVAKNKVLNDEITQLKTLSSNLQLKIDNAKRDLN